MGAEALRRVLPDPALEGARRVKHQIAPAVEAARRATDPRRRQHAARVRSAMELPTVPSSRKVKGSVWAISMVRNEADIIGQTVEHFFRQGIDGMLIADNLSTDGTPEILRDLAATHRLFIAADREPAMFQNHKMDVLARWATEAGADWIVPFDADEFWFAPGRTLAEGLRHCRTPIAAARIHSVFPRPGSELGDGTWRIDSERGLWWQEKVAFRSHPLASINEGNHSVVRPGERSEALRIAHVPWRSFDQYRRKVRDGAAALLLTGMHVGGDHWLDLNAFDDDQLFLSWERLLTGQADERIAWIPRGRLLSCEPTAWSTWDPEGLLADDCA